MYGHFNTQEMSDSDSDDISEFDYMHPDYVGAGIIGLSQPEDDTANNNSLELGVKLTNRRLFL